MDPISHAPATRQSSQPGRTTTSSSRARRSNPSSQPLLLPTSFVAEDKSSPLLITADQDVRCSSPTSPASPTAPLVVNLPGTESENDYYRSTSPESQAFLGSHGGHNSRHHHTVHGGVGFVSRAERQSQLDHRKKSDPTVTSTRPASAEPFLQFSSATGTTSPDTDKSRGRSFSLTSASALGPSPLPELPEGSTLQIPVPGCGRLASARPSIVLGNMNLIQEVDRRHHDHTRAKPQYFELERVVITSKDPPEKLLKKHGHHHHHHHHNHLNSGGLKKRKTAKKKSSSMKRKVRKRSSPQVYNAALDAVDGIVTVLSAIYAKLIVVIGLCFPMAEVISHRIPIGWYEGFYLYLYCGSILFLMFVYLFLLPEATPVTSLFWSLLRRFKRAVLWIGRKTRSLKRRIFNINWMTKVLTLFDHVVLVFKITCGSGSRSRESDSKNGTAPCWDPNVEENSGLNGLNQDDGDGSSIETSSDTSESNTATTRNRSRLSEVTGANSGQRQCGSFYLRLGALGFGIGSMIYSGLEFGQFFELESKEHCYSFLYGLTPGAHMAFTFMQLYFVFMNSRVVIWRHKLIARFGLMHMIATNLCVWLHVLIQETKHQMVAIINPNMSSLTAELSLAAQVWDKSHSPSSPLGEVVSELSEDYFDTSDSEDQPHVQTTPAYAMNAADAHMMKDYIRSSLSGQSHNRPVRSVIDHEFYTTHGECRRSNVIGQLVQDASAFLFPCTIEYSLICAAMLYIMWKYISKPVPDPNAPLRRAGGGHVVSGPGGPAGAAGGPAAAMVTYHHKHHYQVDCARAHKGLFSGVLILVACIISLILFFVFIKKPELRKIAVLQAHIVELFIYCITATASLIAIFQVRELKYNRHQNVELDNILLIVAQIGLYVFTIFSVIGAQFFNLQQNTKLVLLNATACLLQATLQSIFILDASRRCAANTDHSRRKPGREMVTFLLVCNFAMWAINTLETRRADSNPVQMHFYGFWAWTIITHVTTPLTIFYRFHSTVCLCDIWKRTYKLKGTLDVYM